MHQAIMRNYTYLMNFNGDFNKACLQIICSPLRLILLYMYHKAACVKCGLNFSKQTTHQIHANCNSVTFYFLEKIIFRYQQEVHSTKYDLAGSAIIIIFGKMHSLNTHTHTTKLFSFS